MDTQTPAAVPSQDGREIDPTILTTQQLWREIASLKELLLTHISRIDKAVIVAHEDSVRLPTEVQEAVSSLKYLHEEKFNSVEKEVMNRRILVNKQIEDIDILMNQKFAGVEKQFQERDIRIEQIIEGATAIANSRFESSEKAIVKSEASILKQIDQQSTNISDIRQTLDDKINDVKDRLTKIEGQGLGRIESRVVTKDIWGYVIGGIMFLIALLTVALSIMRH